MLPDSFRISRTWIRALPGTIALFSGLFGAQCGAIETRLSREIFLTSGDVTDRPEVPVEEFVQHSERVYSYRLRFYRSLVVRGRSGWIVVDPMNARLAARLMTRLQRDFPGVPVQA